MNAAVLSQAGTAYEVRCELAKEQRDSRDEDIKTRADELAAQMVADMTPDADRALREALEMREFDDTILDILHALLWRPALASTATMVGDLKARLRDLAAVDCDVYDAALKQATEEIDHPEGYVPCDGEDDYDFGGAL